jgi:hypothetical protein
MKSLLIQHILETWPLKPGRRVLGEWITDRRFHSVLTASDEYDLRPSQVANLLRDAKLEGALDLPEFERIYPTDAVDHVLAAVSGSLSYAKAEIQLGMSRTHLQTFVAAGFIQCSLGGDSARPKFAQKDIATFKDRHRDLPVVNAQRLHGSALTIAEAARKHGKSVVDIYRLIIDKTLTGVSVTSDALLFSDIRIDAEELANHFKAEGKEVFLPMVTCSKELSLGSAFIRELSTKGYLDTFDVLDERTHQRKTVMRQQDVLEFGHTFVSRRKLARLNGVKVREVQKRLDKAGLVPVEASGDGKEFLFLREDILPVEGLNKRQEVHEA